MPLVESFDHNHCRIDIYQDDEGDWGNPREGDNLGIMYCEHRNYILGDMDSKYIPEIQFVKDARRELEDRGYDLSRLARYLRVALGASYVLPLYLFDHSGLAMTTCAAEFAAWDAQSWDWGQVGIIFDSARTREMTGVRPSQVAEQLVSEVTQYDAYLHGSVYGYSVTNIATGIMVGGCGGFLVVSDEDMDELRAEAKAEA